MYINDTKRTIAALILCLAMFLICFTMHISATTDSDPGTASSATESDPASSDVSTDVVSSEPVSSEEPVTSSEEESDPSSADSEAVSSEAVSSDESQPVSSLPESSLPVSSADASSAATSSLSVETVSEGGAPDDTYVSEYHNDGSYVYEGSYTGLSSSVSSNEDENQTASVNRNPPHSDMPVMPKSAWWFSVFYPLG